jgi:hypothetical protein
MELAMNDAMASTTACGVGHDIGPTAAQAALESDPAYIRMLEARSTWPYKYNMEFTQPRCVGTPIWGLNAPHVGTKQVDTYNKLLPRHMRVHLRASHNRPQAELYGTAPYMAIGRGSLLYPDIDNSLRNGNWVPSERNRILSETHYDRRDFIRIPRELRDLPFESRFGQMTRVGPEYLDM